MPSTLRNVAFDCADPYALASFWSAVVGAPLHDEDAPGDPEAVVVRPDGPHLFFQRVPEPKRGKNRVHVCLEPDQPRDAEVERLVGLGATVLDDRRNSDGTGWVVLGDPEGNELCVLRPAAERTATDPRPPLA